jgi:2-iminobutanoate/2-iminopropanoate deaminase
MKTALHALAILFFALAACVHANGPEYLHAPGVEPGSLPYSEAVRAGDLLFLSGMIGLEPGTRQVVDGGVQPETRAVLEAIRDALERHGSAMDQVVKCNVFLTDIAKWPAMNEVYVEFFPDNRPARTAVEASGLPLGASVEIACTAMVGE